MRIIVLSILVLILLSGCVTISKEYISEVPVEKQIEVPVKEIVTKVKYEQDNLFAQKPGTVEVALVKTQEFSTNADLIINNIYQYLTTIPDLNRKYIIYDEKTLKQLFSLNDFTIEDDADINVLKENHIDYVIYISDIGVLGNQFKLHILDLVNESEKKSIQFKNSFESNYLNDLKFFFLQQEVPVYYDEEITTGTTYKTVTELVERKITHDYKAMPWGGRILLAAGIIGVVYILANQ